ncbi:NAD-dependent epimerase/dehydratase family protein [Paraconexibacter sp.]|uniref:NAD-dependent epimerase/dehydratase family protein n=1 Tax=Paraconexibacter sp. TaxID=2949640 RepID=UPI00356484FC
MPPSAGLTVAVTGPTGEIGKPFIRALEDCEEVARIVGMARRPFDPTEHGWTRTEYRQGDVLDADAVAGLVADADVVVHLAFIIQASGDSREVNLRGSRNVFTATAAAGVPRLVYASSVAAYGFHDDAPELLTEDVPTRGTDRHPYSAQKAEVEEALAEDLAGSPTQAWVFRPCIVAGPEATLLVDMIPGIGLGDRLPGAVRALFDQVPVLKPVLPDPGLPFQLVHHDDVAEALVAAVLGRGEPGVYNLAGPGVCGVGDIAAALGWYSVPIPELAVDATAEIVARLPFLPPEAHWIEAFRQPVLMDSTRARSLLGWAPKHDAQETLRATVAAARPRLAPG